MTLGQITVMAHVVAFYIGMLMGLSLVTVAIACSIASIINLIGTLIWDIMR